MKQNNKLNKALKDAFHEQTEPLYEAQWERLSVALGEQKKKRRFPPWFFLLFFAATSLFAGYWLGGYRDKQNTQATHHDKTATGGSSQSLSTQQEPYNHGQTSDQGTGEAAAGITGAHASALQVEQASGEPHLTHRAGKWFPDQKGKMAKKGLVAMPQTSEQEKTIRGQAFYDEALSSLSIHGPWKINARNDVDSLPLMISMAELYQVKPKKRPKLPRPNMDMAKFAIGLSSGISPVRFSIADIKNEEKLHKDTRAIYAQSNKYSRSYYGNFNFEYLLSRRIAVFLSTGIQYRQIVQDVNLSYELREIVFRDSTGNILSYIPAINPLVFEYQQKNHLDFISIPVKISYLMPIGGENELMFSAGLNISALVKTRGSVFSVNEVDFKPLKQSYTGKLNAGLCGGLQYNRHIYKAFWMGLETQWQRNSLNSDVQYGVIRNRISISNYNIQLKYKF